MNEIAAAGARPARRSRLGAGAETADDSRWLYCGSHGCRDREMTGVRAGVARYP